MADPLSITASLLAVITAAVQSTNALRATVIRFKGRDKTLARLQNELCDLVTILNAILNALEHVIDTEASMLSLLKGPVERCIHICREFEQSMETFARKSKTGFRDWTKMEFMRGDIHEFMDTISGYKSTLSVGLGTFTIHDAKVSRKALQDHKEMIQDTVYNLEVHLQRVDKKMARLTTDTTNPSSSIVDLKDEKEVTKQCLHICEDLDVYIASLGTHKSPVPHGSKNADDSDFSFRGPVGIHLGQAPYIGHELFGRRCELDEMVKVLLPDHKPQEQRHLVLGGIAGIGKTQLAIAFVESSRGSYDSVFWLNAASEATLKDSYRSLAKLIFIQNHGAPEDEEIVRRVHQWLSDPNNTMWLLIFDSYDPDQFQIDHYYPPASHGAIIVTTRWPDLVVGNTLRIKPLHNIEDSLAMLQSISKRENVQSERLAGYPLALAIAGNHIHRNAFTFERYLEEYENRFVNLPGLIQPQEYMNFPLNVTLDMSHSDLEVTNPQEFQERCQSDIADSRSIFSLQSMQSTALTTDTHYTIGEMSTAIDELVSIFTADKEMAALYTESMVELRITTTRFVRNFRRLLKGFALGLKEEAQEAVDIDLANLISARAGLIADKIGSKLEQQYSQPGTTSIHPQRMHVKNEFQTYPTEECHDLSSDGDDEHPPEGGPDGHFAALVSHGRSFIEGSTALQKLRQDFKKFIRPPRRNTGLETQSFLEVQSSFKRWINLRFSRMLGGDMEYEAPGWTVKAHLSLNALLSLTGLLEKPQPKNHQRFRWTNVRVAI
ncbi:TPR repeat protein [Penicillium frequentans]|nr:TPR repeat protein [Penicillium glabrum]